MHIHGLIVNTAKNHEATTPDDADSSPMRSLRPELQLSMAVEDATLLVAFAAQSLHGLEQAKVGALNEAIAALRATWADGRDPSAEQTTAFWIAYDAIAIALAPVSAYSIRATRKIHHFKPLRQLFSSTTVLATVALLFFWITVTVQAHWLAGRELLNESAEANKRRSELVQKLRAANDDLARLDDLVAFDAERAGVAPRTKPTTGGASAPVGANATIDLLETQYRQAKRRVASVDQELKDATGAIEQIQPNLLNWYKSAMGYTCLVDRLLCDLSWIADHERERDKLAAAQAEAASAPVDAASSAEKAGLFSNLLGWFKEKDRARRETQLAQQRAVLDEKHSKTIQQRVRTVLVALETYFVPMLMGLLGSLTYMLRKLVVQLRDHSYTPIFVSLALVRLCLGTMAGVLGGLVIPAEEATLKSLPPTALPFVFGYAIEVLFAALDRLIHAFTHSAGTPPRPG